MADYTGQRAQLRVKALEGWAMGDIMGACARWEECAEAPHDLLTPQAASHHFLQAAVR